MLGRYQLFIYGRRGFIFFFTEESFFFPWKNKGHVDGGDVYIVYREVNEIFLRNIINKLLDGVL